MKLIERNIDRVIEALPRRRRRADMGGEAVEMLVRVAECAACGPRCADTTHAGIFRIENAREECATR